MTATLAKGQDKPESILIRVSPETYAALQLAQPFVERRSMQDLVAMIVNDYLVALRTRNAGFEKALVGLRESQARQTGVLSRSIASGDRAENLIAAEDD